MTSNKEEEEDVIDGTDPEEMEINTTENRVWVREPMTRQGMHGCMWGKVIRYEYDGYSRAMYVWMLFSLTLCR